MRRLRISGRYPSLAISYMYASVVEFVRVSLMLMISGASSSIKLKISLIFPTTLLGFQCSSLTNLSLFIFIFPVDLVLSIGHVVGLYGYGRNEGSGSSFFFYLLRSTPLVSITTPRNQFIIRN
jgi:hypothetical protein